MIDDLKRIADRAIMFIAGFLGFVHGIVELLIFGPKDPDDL